MKKIKIFFLVLSVMMITVIFYKGVATAAQVTRINAKKGLIVIDGKKSEGFIMGAKVCFYSSSGEEITCGRVHQTSEYYATIKVSNTKAIKLKYGMEAKLYVEKTDK
jgi:hypothetical protein